MQPFKELLKIYLLFIALFFIGRLGLYIVYFDRLSDITFAQSLLSFLYGLKLDTMTVSIILIIPALLLSIIPQLFSKFIGKIVNGYVLIFLLIALYIENATFPFVAQYDVRPNYLFIEYLKYPQEVSSMILKEYPMQLIATLLMLIAMSWIYLKFSPLRLVAAIQTPLWKRLAIFPIIVVILFIGIRSSFGHRPANISDALYSTNRMVNEIAKNSLYSIGYAYYGSTKEGELTKPYGKMQLAQAYRRVGQQLNITHSGEFPFNREQLTHFPAKKPKNLVIFIQESLGSQFVGFSGGDVAITPNLEKLSHEGLAFTNHFSNGTRSIQGLAGLSAGFLPLPGEGVVKRNKSQSDFFTVASLLKPMGYKSSFIYGGEGRFDNMRSWYMGNGFDEVIEQKDFSNPTFVSSWGVCDEDLVIKANGKFKEYAKNNQKFVTVMFSQSNHSPFELPEGKIDFIKGKPKRSVENAVKYADFAIGKFFALARKESYYKDTVFVVAADHNVRVYGDDLVPVNMFHIPALIIADGLKPQKYTTLSTQPDVLATALDLVGANLTYPILGHSIFCDAKKEMAFMLFNESFALRVKDKVAIIQPNKEPLTFIYHDEHLVSTAHDSQLEKDALAFVVVMDDMYNKKLYRMKK